MDQTEYMVIGTAAFLVLTGFAARKYPMLIAGYNTMAKKERERIDIDRLSMYTRNWLIICGLIHISGYNLARFLDYHNTTVVMGASLGLPLIIGIIWANVFMDFKKTKS